MVVKRFLEPLVEPGFYGDSYEYRPGKSALDAVGAARQRAWVLDLDIKALFDSIDRDLLMRAVHKRTNCPWVLLHRKWTQRNHPGIPFERYADDAICHCRGTANRFRTLRLIYRTTSISFGIGCRSNA
jgi:RNA-directed DNA polymerase